MHLSLLEYTFSARIGISTHCGTHLKLKISTQRPAGVRFRGFSCRSDTQCQTSLTGCMAVSKSTADKVTDTIVKCSARNCRVVNIVENKNFTKVLKVTLDSYIDFLLSYLIMLSRLFMINQALRDQD